MVDPDPGYRPRRAFVDPAAAGDKPPATPAGPDGAVPPAAEAEAADLVGGATAMPGASTGSDPREPAKSDRKSPAAGDPTAPAAETAKIDRVPADAAKNDTLRADPVPPAAAPRPDGPKAPVANGRAGVGPTPEDAAPPLYRDEQPASAPRNAAAGEAASEETRIVRPLNFQQRRPQPVDEDATTLLPRTAAGSRRPKTEREELDSDDRPHGLLGPRVRLALLVGAVAAVVVVGLAIMYAVGRVGTPTANPSPSVSGPPTAGTGSPTTGTDPALLGDEVLLTPVAAEQIADRSWKVALTQRGTSPDAPTAACLGDQPVDGEPTPQTEVVRLLSSSGKAAPSALHQAAAYASPQDAAQAFAVAARSFGGCATPGSYISSGAAVTGLGDEAAGLVVNVVDDGKTQWHTVVLSRTGRVVNILDAAQVDRALGVAGVAKALAAVTASQCPADGECATKPAVKAGPPPLGGDVPGFLAAGDLPPVGDANETWVATPVDQPSEDFLGSQCETVNWARTGAESATSRVYLVPSSTKFGLNDIVLTMKDEKAAENLVAKVRSDLKSCSKRQLTATVTDPKKISGVGASGAEVTGWSSTVSQKSTEGTQRYRVGIVSSGPRVAYTFLNPLSGGYDLSQGEWDTVAVRAGQRMTQVP